MPLSLHQIRSRFHLKFNARTWQKHKDIQATISTTNSLNESNTTVISSPLLFSLSDSLHLRFPSLSFPSTLFLYSVWSSFLNSSFLTKLLLITETEMLYMTIFYSDIEAVSFSIKQTTPDTNMATVFMFHDEC